MAIIVFIGETFSDSLVKLVKQEGGAELELLLNPQMQKLFQTFLRRQHGAVL